MDLCKVKKHKFALPQSDTLDMNQQTDKKIPGWNFLNNHRNLEKDLDLDRDHVVVDREDWEKVLKLLNSKPELMEELTKV